MTNLENGSDDENIEQLWLKMSDIVHKMAMENIPLQNQQKRQWLAMDELEIAMKQREEKTKSKQEST